MKARHLFSLLGIAASILFATKFACADAAAVGSAAPNFTVKDSSGKDVSLTDFKGKTVVLEWFNQNCPFVKKFYSKGDMQRFQDTTTSQGVVWLTITSSAEGKNGYLDASTAPEVREELAMKSTALLLDSSGAVGKLYGARTTPHTFVVDPKGTLVYAGAIDSEPSTSSSDIATATNYVLGAVDAIKAGKAVDPSSTEPYGCSVKY